MSSSSFQMKEYIEPGSCVVGVRQSIESNEEIPSAPPPTPVLKAATPANPVVDPQQLDDDGIHAIPSHAAAASGAAFIAQSVAVIADADAIVNAPVAGPGDLYNPGWVQGKDHNHGMRSGAPSQEQALRPSSPSMVEKEDVGPPSYDAPYYPPRNPNTIGAWERHPSDLALRHDVQKQWNEQARLTYPRFNISIEEVEPSRQDTPVNLAAAAADAVADGADRNIGGLWTGWEPILADMAAQHLAMFGVDEELDGQLEDGDGSEDGEEGGVIGVDAPAVAQLPPPRTAFEDIERADAPKPNVTFSAMGVDDDSSTTLGKPKSSVASRIAPIVAIAVCLGLTGLVIAMMAIGKLHVGAGVTVVAMLLLCGAVKYFDHVLYSFGCRNRWVLAKRNRHMASRNPASLV